MRALSLTALVSILAASCGGPADVALTPKTVKTERAVASASASAAPVVEEGPAVKPRVAGSAYEPSASEPLPSGAIARCGTTSMRLSERAPLAVTDAGTIYAFRNNTELVELRTNEVVARLPQARRAVFAPDATKLMVHHSNEVMELFAVPSGKSLGSTKIELTKPKQQSKPRVATLLNFSGPSRRSEYINDVEFSADGSRVVVSTSFGALHVIDGSSGKRLKTLKVPDAKLVGLSRDGSRALVSLQEPGSRDVPLLLGSDASSLGISVINLNTGAKLVTKNYALEKPEVPSDPSALPPRRTREHSYASHGLSLDGATVYRLELGTFTSIDVASGKEEQISKAASDPFSVDYMGAAGALEMLNDGRSARRGGTLIDLATGVTSPTKAFAFRSQNGAYELAHTGSVVHLSTEEVQGHVERVAALSFLPNGEALASADGSLHFWDTASCEELAKPALRARDFRAARDAGVLAVDGYPTLIVRGKEVTEIKDALSARNLALSSDGARLFVGTSDYEAAELEKRDTTAAGALVASVLVGGSTSGVVVSPGGSRVAVQVRKDTQTEVQLRNAETLELEATLPDSDDQLQFFGEDQLLQWDAYRGARVVSLPTMKELYKVGTGGCCSALAVSKDQRRIAGAAGNDVYVWERSESNGANVKFLAQLSGHTEAVTSLAFSAEGVLASGSADTTVLLWDVDAAAKQPASAHLAKAQDAQPTLASRWSTGDYAGRDFIKDDGTVEWSNPNAKHPALASVLSLATNFASTCAITEAPAGKVRCWGTTRGGVLGVPEKPGSKPYQFLAEEKPVVVPNISDAVRVSLGGDYGCALHAGGKLSCWGRMTRDPVAVVTAPKEILSGVTSFAVQSAKACALTTAGEFVCWTSSESPNPVAIASKVASFAMGRSHLCVLGRDGRVSCAGRAAQLGDGTSDDRQTLGPLDRVVNASELAASDAGTCVRAMPAGGEEGVYCWGHFAHADHLLPTLMRGLANTTGLLLLGDRVCAAKAGRLVCLVK
jgi:WD40 repeat protein